jgi:hypothetical protein
MRQPFTWITLRILVHCLANVANDVQYDIEGSHTDSLERRFAFSPDRWWPDVDVGTAVEVAQPRASSPSSKSRPGLAAHLLLGHLSKDALPVMLAVTYHL